jgi:hypothetical protein
VDNPVKTVDNVRPQAAFGEGPSGMRTALGVFAKEPLPGLVKTRLSPPLTGEEAAQLYRACLEETVAALGALPCDLVLFYAGGEAFFRENFPEVRLLPQGKGGLGGRMERALGLLLGEGYAAAALVGSDAPDLPPALVAEAFAALRSAEVVTVPARDGGYVLVGESRHRPELFRGIPWSSGGVLAATRRRAREAGAAYREVGAWEDVDDLAALRRLLQRSPRSTTARLAQALLARYGLQG